MTINNQSIVEVAQALDVDAFANGFALGAPGAPWFHVSMGA
jgi:hypothetical protein